MAYSPDQWQAIKADSAAAYGVNPRVIDAINQREQSGTSNFVVNDWDSNAKIGTPSGGPMQYIKPTFMGNARRAREANPAAWRGVPMDWRNAHAQALAASWAIANGHGKQWSTWKKAVADAGGQVKGPQATRTPISAPSTPDPGNAPRAGLTSAQQRAVSMVFDDSPRMQSLLSMAGQRQPPTPARNDHAGHDHNAAPHAPVNGGPGNDYKSLMSWALNNFGAKTQGNFQTTGGKHEAGSNHYKGRAIDLGDANTSRKQFNQIAAYARRNPGAFREFYYDPLGWYIKNGKIIKGSIGGHGDHLHMAV